MNNFTKKYIELAKDKKIQGLRPSVNKYDFVCGKDEVDIFPVYVPDTVNCLRDNIIWLPQSHDLDEEIIKIINKKEYTKKYNEIEGYQFYYEKKSKEYEAWIIDSSESDCYLEGGVNPLIAKIKLLKELIKE